MLIYKKGPPQVPVLDLPPDQDGSQLNPLQQPYLQSPLPPQQSR
jgi:hypothetical protein